MSKCLYTFSENYGLGDRKMPAKILGGLAELYYKPQTGQLILRKVGITKTDKWISNVKPRTETFARKMEGHSFPSVCKGKKWKEFIACLRREGKKYWESH